MSITVPKFASSQSEAWSIVLISYDIKSLTWYATISRSLWSKVVLLYDQLKRGFTNKTELRNLNLAVFSGRKKKTKLERARQLRDVCRRVLRHSDWKNWVRISNSSLNFDFENLENETPNKRVGKRQKRNLVKDLKTKVNQHKYIPCKHGFNRAINITGFLAEFGYGKYLIVLFWYASEAYQARLVSPWVFWLDCVSPKYEPWLDQIRLIWRWSVPKRYD